MERFAWGNIHAIHTMWLCVLCAGILYIGNIRRLQKLKRLLSQSLIPVLVPISQKNNYFWRSSFLVASFFFAALALMRPQFDFTYETIKQKGTDVIIALDVSNSMLATDISPSRFERSKLEIINMVDQLEGDRVGLVLFTSKALTQCPLTIDYATLKLFLDDVSIGALSQGGTSLTAAIDKAINSFDKRYKKERILIIVTDGETHDDRLNEALERAKKNGLRIFCIGLGSTQGVPIKIPKEYGGRGEFLKDGQGNIVVTKLNEEPLKKAALTTGGAYVQAQVSGFNLLELYKKWISPIEGRELEQKRKKRYEENFYLPLSLALLFLLIHSFWNVQFRPKRNKIK